jgi:hypothetical protein
MALSITQTPATASLAQSPIIFTVAESNLALLTSSSFQYVGELYYWQGSPFQSGSADYTITKFPNTSNVGIFDLNRIINSTLTDLLIQNPSNVVYFACDFYTQFFNGTTYITGSHVKSEVYKALDGYGIFPETIGQQLNTLSQYYPLLTDGPVSQSAFLTNRGSSGAAVGTLGGTVADRIIYSGSTGNGIYFLSSSVSSSGQIDDYPIGPLQSGFPISTIGLTDYTIQPFNGSTALGSKIRYDIVCEQKYPNVRIKWKNRFGQFDYLNFNMVNKQSISTTKRTYQPQLGSWEGSTFSYQSYDSAMLDYIVDTKQSLQVNTNWLNEDYNDILKQLIVSDEIYWVYNETTEAVRPISIVTSNLQFKTGVVDKVIQYQFEFNLGQSYKLIM